MRLRTTILCSTTLATLALAGVTPAFAQDTGGDPSAQVDQGDAAPLPKADTSKSGDDKDIIVTGSRIKR